MKEKHEWFYKLIKLVLGIFGFHLSKNPPKGPRKKTVETGGPAGSYPTAGE